MSLLEISKEDALAAALIIRHHSVEENTSTLASEKSA
jgi:hypothetical protein